MPKPKPNTTEPVMPLEARVIQCIHDFQAPKTTQDAVDQMAAEYAVANILRQQAEKRYDSIKRTIVEANEAEVTKLRETAASQMAKTVQHIRGAEWSIQLAANKPTTRVDAGDLRTELIKRGVKAELIDTAISKVEKKNTAALLITTQRE